MPGKGVPFLRRRPRRGLGWHWLLLGALVTGFTLALLSLIVPLIPAPRHRSARPISLVILQPPEDPDPDPIDEDDDQDYEGQIVELAPPEEEVAPEDAEYLSKYDIVVEEETRTERFEVNPEVLAKQYAEEQVAEQKDVVDLNVERDSTGATVGNNRFDPNVDGTMAALPSPWAITNKEGPLDPVRSSQTEAMLMGAPQNDLVNERVGDAMNLNSTKYPYAGYMDRIKRQVNFWWEQNLNNLPSSTRLSKNAYTTVVDVVLNSEGALEFIEVTEESGSPELDEALVSAFRMAGPFENPPEGLIQKDGRVYLSDFAFQVNFATARMQYQGIDPRAGVQFPGILKSPR